MSHILSVQIMNMKRLMKQSHVSWNCLMKRFILKGSPTPNILMERLKDSIVFLNIFNPSKHCCWKGWNNARFRTNFGDSNSKSAKSLSKINRKTAHRAKFATYVLHIFYETVSWFLAVQIMNMNSLMKHETLMFHETNMKRFIWDIKPELC